MCEKEGRKPGRKGGRVGRPRARPSSGDMPVADAILLVAGQLFRSQGFAATTTRQIADAAGIRQPSLFHYFRSKTEILKAIAQRAVRPELEFIAAEAERSQSASVALYRYAYFVALNLSVNPHAIGSPQRFPVTQTEEFTEFGEAYERIRATCRALVRAGMSSGEFTPGDAHLTSDFLFALLETPLERSTVSEEPVKLAATAACLVLRAILSEPHRLKAIAVEARAHELNIGRESK